MTQSVSGDYYIPSVEEINQLLEGAGRKNRRGVSMNAYEEIRPDEWVSWRTALRHNGLAEDSRTWYGIQKGD